MSDSDDDERVTKLNFKKDRIHFGSLDESKTVLDAPAPKAAAEEGEPMVEFSTEKSDTESDDSGEEGKFLLFLFWEL